MALQTVADYLSDGRTLLQDLVPPYRYDDDSLVTALNLAMYETRRLREDLFAFYRDTPQFDSGDQEVSVPLEDRFREALLFQMCSHALLRDQEDIQDARASQFAAAANSMLVGNPVRTPMPPPQRGG
jgi:hypothetical protein